MGIRNLPARQIEAEKVQSTARPPNRIICGEFFVFICFFLQNTVREKRKIVKYNHTHFYIFKNKLMPLFNKVRIFN